MGMEIVCRRRLSWSFGQAMKAAIPQKRSTLAGIAAGAFGAQATRAQTRHLGWRTSSHGQTAAVTFS